MSTEISWKTFEEDVRSLAQQIELDPRRNDIKKLYGVPRGGLVIAVRLSHLLGLPLVTLPPSGGVSSGKVVVVDDVSDTGVTLKRLLQAVEADTPFVVTLYRKDGTVVEPRLCVRTINDWIVFPWEKHGHHR